MLKIENNLIVGNTYNIKDELKNLGACWNKDKKCYMVDKYTLEAVQKFLTEVNENTDKHLKLCWQKALDKYELAMVSKQHPLYPQILESFKEFKQSP
jgi:hypothetical protein